MKHIMRSAARCSQDFHYARGAFNITPMSDIPVAAKLRTWLRSERAMGLHSLVLAPPAPPPAAATAASAVPAETTALFVETPQIPGVIEEILAGPPLAAAEKRARLAAMDAKEVSVCRHCRLCESRTRTVFGEGDPDAKIVFIGEGPGENEDQTGRPFVGRAGQLLDKMIIGMGLKREQVFICNVVKCRPPNNRTPAPDEVAACTPYLVRQIGIIRPRVIVTLGLPAAKYMLNSNNSMGRLRGQWHDWRGIKLMPTYHPAFLLRAYTDENRAAVWSDLKKVMSEVGLKPAK
jgi:uracil-DNA glycosylase